MAGLVCFTYLEMDRRMPLPPTLRYMVEENLESMEVVSGKLRKGIECNGFRLLMKDPRARTEMLPTVSTVRYQPQTVRLALN